MHGHHIRTQDDRREDETPRIVDVTGLVRKPAAHPAPVRHAGEDETLKVTCCTRPPAARGADALPLRFGDWLVRRELISRGELYAALDHCYRRTSPRRLGDALVALRVLDRQLVEEEARAFLSFTTFTVALSPAALPGKPLPSRRLADELEQVDEPLARHPDRLEGADRGAD